MDRDTEMVDQQVLRQLPKVELHCHLEGSLRPDRVIELAEMRGVTLPTADPDALYVYDDLAGFLAVYELACRSLTTPDDFAVVTYESLEDAARGSNIVYREMFFNPTLHPDIGYADMLSGILAGLRAAHSDFGITTRLIPSIYRQMSVGSAMEMIELVVAHRTDEVIGIGMDGDEISAPPERFAAVYRAAASAGLHRTAHVAHDGPASFIITCLDELGCERIDHGYHVVDDPALIARLSDDGVAFACATPTPPLCGWPASIDDSPIRTMVDAGLKVVLNSDDPTMLGTDLGTEFVRAAASWSLAPERIKQFVTDALGAAWLDDTDRAALSAAIIPDLDRMLCLTHTEEAP